jgi:hypothetical protein
MNPSAQPRQTDQVLMHQTPAGWLAEFRGPLGAQMQAMAGTDTVLTCFHVETPAAVVCRAIAMLNPNARVSVAVSTAAASAARSTVDSAADLARTIDAVVRAPEAKAPAKVPELRPAINRAMKIKRRFGLLVACSYLREQGWTFEAAHRTLQETLPRERQADAQMR